MQQTGDTTDGHASGATTTGAETGWSSPQIDAGVAVPGGARRVSVLRWSSGLLEQLTRVFDGVILLAAGLASGIGAAPSVTFPTGIHRAAAALALTAAAASLIGHISGYTLRRLRQRFRPSFDAVLAIGLSAGGLEAALRVSLHPAAPDHRWLVSWVILSVAGIVLARLIQRQIVTRGLRSGLLRRKVALIGATIQAQHLIESLARHDRHQPSLVIGIYDERATRRPDSAVNLPVAGNVDALCAYASDHPVDLIVIALPWARAMEIFRLIQRVQWISADVMIPMEAGIFNVRTASVNAIAGEPALQVMRQPLQGARSLVKLIEDYAIASVAIMLAAPVMLGCALLIRLDSPGPILFRQERVGFNRHNFQVLKFRTMTVDDRDDGSVGVLRGDPRITRVGRWLRRASLDELPQLFNVLAGDMSVVGPRPHVPGMRVGDEAYSDAVQDYAARHRIKPGITGWAQINGMRGGIHELGKARRGVDLDMSYVENWSLGLDMRIMLRTLAVGMFGAKVF